MNKKLNIGICRTSPLHLITNNCFEDDISVHFVKGFIDMFQEHNLIIKTPTNTEEEKSFNNQKLFTKYPYIKSLEYKPFEDSDLDVLFIFSKPKENITHYLIDGTTYENHIFNIIEKKENLLVFYIQYNDVKFEFKKDFNFDKTNFIALFNSPLNSSIIYTNKYYFGKDINGYCLDLNELVFSNRISNRINFYNKVMLFNDTNKLDYEELKNPNSMKEYIYTLNEYNNNEDNDYIKNSFTNNHSIFLEKLQNSNFVIFDYKNNEDFYNPYYFIIANYTYPVILNKDNKLQINLEDIHYYNYIDIDNYYSQKYIKQLRIELKNYFKDYDLKSKLINIIKIEKD